MSEESATGWIVHDGSGGPRVSHRQNIEIAYDKVEAEGKLTTQGVGCISPSYPGFFWRWKRVRVGWLRYEMRRVCDDPEYAPIKAYRLQKPRSTAVSLLTSIVEQPPGQWIKDGTDGDPRLPKKVPA
jgi:hypothetical protein